MKLLLAPLAALMVSVAIVAHAKLPPLSPEAQAKADEAKAKAAWTDKLSAFQLCKAQDRVVEAYRKTAATAGSAALKPPAAASVSAAAATASSASASSAAAAASAPRSASASPSAAVAPCTDPGPFVYAAPADQKPIEASGAHSPPATATSPPSVSPATQTELQGPKK